MRETSLEPDRLPNAPHPRETLALVGHSRQEQAFLDALRSGRMHHAWLIGGPEGIGKATFAYRAARFVLAAGDPLARAGATDSLAMPEGDAATRRIIAQSHPDLHLLRRTVKPDGKSVTSNIPVDQVRKVIDRFGASAAEGGWRVCIVDSAEDMDRASANALLKLLEEPPARALFLIIAHAPGRLLPTIRSRCRLIGFEALSEAEVAEAGEIALERMGDPFDGSALRRAATLADGSVRRALTYVDPETLALVEAVRARLDALPGIDLTALMALAEDVAGRAGESDFAIMIETIQSWLSDHLHAHAAAGAGRLAPLAEVWEKLGRAAREVETYNLDRRPLVMTMFHDLSDAVRRSRAA
ncbi:DNA polymerase III subunit delta' [Bosea sp. BK604]|uniref:DNA polymerase III subunit delta' n=1 Tax=Bosea sp. BK604 TaxID=2512180 RepID=UPI00104D53FB|nr:DNA polymerase III subunit delta' [Bosea sp. BK604]TCR66635.1 DNA polymerase-3 subunit delta' [Bosea sp. BK604]